MLPEHRLCEKAILTSVAVCWESFFVFFLSFYFPPPLEGLAHSNRFFVEKHYTIVAGGCCRGVFFSQFQGYKLLSILTVRAQLWQPITS